MARDYSRQSNGGQRRNGGKNGKSGARSQPRPAAKRNRKTTRKAAGGTPGWVWLASGLCIGLTIAAGVYVFARPADTGANERVAIDMPAAAREAGNEAAEEQPSGEAAAEEEQEPRFAFYKMLPNYEVVIPEEEYPDDSGDTDSAEAAAPVEPQPTTPKVREPGRFVIQAGSFSTREDANRRKAELALLGIEAHIVSFDLDSGKTVYRVQSSTIESNERLNELLKRLRENRIDTLVMQRKG